MNTTRRGTKTNNADLNNSKLIQTYDINSNFRKYNFLNKCRLDRQTIQPIKFDSFANASHLIKPQIKLKKHRSREKKRNVSVQNSINIIRVN